jgi:catechol 2,3-dioxygenase-like lactoylglutathione lyase family enzyme
MASLRHIAICTKKPRETAEFYERIFALKILDVVEEDAGTYVFSSDGVVNVAFLDYHSDAAAQAVGIPDSSYVGIHHIGFVDANPAERLDGVRAAQGKVIMEPDTGSDEFYFEYKIRDPNGIVVDISRGWPVSEPAGGDHSGG